MASLTVQPDISQDKMSSHCGTPDLTTATTETSSSLHSDEKSTTHSTGRIGPETIIPHSGPAHPTHFLGRGNGKFTPLVALDELPSNIKVHGLMLSMTFSEVVQVGGQLCMPALEIAKDKYVVVIENDAGENDVVARNTVVANSEVPRSVNVPSTSAINVSYSWFLEFDLLTGIRQGLLVH